MLLGEAWGGCSWSLGNTEGQEAAARWGPWCPELLPVVETNSARENEWRGLSIPPGPGEPTQPSRNTASAVSAGRGACQRRSKPDGQLEAKRLCRGQAG